LGAAIPSHPFDTEVYDRTLSEEARLRGADLVEVLPAVLPPEVGDPLAATVDEHRAARRTSRIPGHPARAFASVFGWLVACIVDTVTIDATIPFIRTIHDRIVARNILV
jgi:hypothetical protein